MLYDFQKDALELTKNNNRCLYAYDMGLGKTFLGSYKALSLPEQKIVVVCQKSKIHDWIEHFKDEHNIDCHDLTKNYEAFICDNWDEKIVGVINYDLIWRRPIFEQLKAFTLILDESSLIQNEHTKRAKEILMSGATNIVMLSGTVINGNYEKLWSQCKLLGWNISKSMFWEHYIISRKVDLGTGFPIKMVVGYKNTDRMKRKLKDYGCVFKKTSEVLDLPEKRIVFCKVPKSSEYDDFDNDRVIDIDGIELVGDYVLTERLYKRFLCGWLSKEKLKAFKDLVESTDDRLVVFYNFNEELNRMMELVDRPVSIVNGKTKDMTAYNSNEDSVTFVQYQAGAMGLNLQKANKIIYFTLPEGQSEMFEQSKKRIHRIGQERPCIYYVLECQGTIEQEIWQNLTAKKNRTDYLFV